MKTKMMSSTSLRALVCALLLALFPASGRSVAVWGYSNLPFGECAWEYIYVGWSWSTGWDCDPYSESGGPWREEGSGGEVWSQEVCGGQYDIFNDLHDEQSWMVQWCYNWYSWYITFSN
jgi:hypothetical protein